mmetsp:Transcript_30427/g.52757  ORF Transcript_30427/g.52757 Transcript_30427/m.52757 type:complete len:89 (+) Transcript_30427:343-609(+)
MTALIHLMRQDVGQLTQVVTMILILLVVALPKMLVDSVVNSIVPQQVTLVILSNTVLVIIQFVKLEICQENLERFILQMMMMIFSSST